MQNMSLGNREQPNANRAPREAALHEAAWEQGGGQRYTKQNDTVTLVPVLPLPLHATTPWAGVNRPTTGGYTVTLATPGAVRFDDSLIPK